MCSAGNGMTSANASVSPSVKARLSREIQGCLHISADDRGVKRQREKTWTGKRRLLGTSSFPYWCVRASAGLTAIYAGPSLSISMNPTT